MSKILLDSVCSDEFKSNLLGGFVTFSNRNYLNPYFWIGGILKHRNRISILSVNFVSYSEFESNLLGGFATFSTRNYLNSHFLVGGILKKANLKLKIRLYILLALMNLNQICLAALQHSLPETT